LELFAISANRLHGSLLFANFFVVILSYFLKQGQCSISVQVASERRNWRDVFQKIFFALEGYTENFLQQRLKYYAKNAHVSSGSFLF